MAVRTTVTRICDLTGAENEDVTEYAFRIPTVDSDGELVVTKISFDATPDAARQFVTDLNKGMAKYLKNDALKVKTVGDANGDSTDQTHIREWARTNGYKVADRGRIPAEVMSAFNAAQESATDETTE